MWKKLLGILLLLIIITAGYILFSASEVQKRANSFFEHIKAGMHDEAYSMLSEEFKQSASQEVLIKFLQRNNLDDYRSIDWKEQSRSGKFTKLTGTISTATDEEITLILRFIQNDDTWQIHSITKVGKGRRPTRKKPVTETTQKESDIPAVADEPTGTMPSHDQILHLAQKTMMKFAHAVNEKSMARIYHHISAQWQQQTSIKELDAIFQSFYHAKVDLMVLEGMTPIFDRPATLSPEEILRLTGHFQTAPNVIHFDNSYMFEDGAWKPIAINVSIK